MNGDKPPQVFISYSHDSEAHREKVLGLSERLRAEGIETFLDQYVNGSPPEGWPRWMLNQLDAAEFVLVVCTETYYRRFRGQEAPGKGKGADWEGALITQELYDARNKTQKFVPIFMSKAVEDWIPEPLRSHTYYVLPSKSGYEGLYDLLLGQAGVEPGKVGTLKTRPRRTATPLTFEETPSPAPPSPPPPPAALNQILPGQWLVQIQSPFPPGVIGQLRLEMAANGLFNGQLMTPMGLTTVQGQWQANPLTNQIGLQGMQTNGFQTIPYVVMVQVSYFDPRHITGVTSAGEQVTWQRTG